jgi:hypothetical protein
VIVKREELIREKYSGNKNRRAYKWIVDGEKLLEISCDYEVHRGWEIWFGFWPNKWANGYRQGAPIHLNKMTDSALLKEVNKVITYGYVAKEVFDNIFRSN